MSVELPDFIWGPPISSHAVLNMFTSFMSGIPISARPSPGTTKNLHFISLSLHLHHTVHTPNCSVIC